MAKTMKKKLWFICGAVVVIGLCGVVVWSLQLALSDQFPVRTSGLEKLIDNKTYIVLLQNNNELRPSGGFMGSYARVKMNMKGLESIAVQDIYVPDGQLPGHVEPPYPIQEAFRQGWWKLRDANWDPDFASAAATVKWFLEEGNEKPVDGIVAINLGLVSRWIDVIGGVKVPEIKPTISASNLYSIAQKYAETGWFPGSTQKKDFLGAVESALIEKTKRSNPVELVKLMALIKEELDKGQILIWLPETNFKIWGGRLEAGWPPNSDYLYIVETNLGANKANCCVSRSVTQSILGNEETVEVNWKNISEFENPLPPVFWGGNYVDYVRVIIPAGAEVQRLRVGGRDLRVATVEDFDFPNSLRQSKSGDIYVIENRGGLQIIGFWAIVPAGGETQMELNYKLTLPRNEILIRRQPGIESFSYQLKVNGKIINRTIDRDTVISSR